MMLAVELYLATQPLVFGFFALKAYRNRTRS